MSHRKGQYNGPPGGYERYIADVRSLHERSRRTLDDGSPDAPTSSKELVESNLFYVVRIAREYSSFGIPFDDLLSEGNVGLIEAADRFDPNRGTQFITYASWWIRKRILNLIARQISVIRLPKYKVERLRRLRTAESNLRLLGQPQISLEHVLNEESGRKVGDSVSETHSAQAEESFISQDYENHVSRILENLPDKERFVLRHRFGFEANKPATLQTIADMLGISRERVRQIEIQALERIRRILATDSLPLFTSGAGRSLAP
jgi:RNA polymerase primary sigma factor